jgi:hypothetical protein
MYDNEVWKQCVGFDGYSISNFGRVRSDPRAHLRKNGRPYTVSTSKIRVACADSKGYLQVLLYNKGKRANKLVHRLVYETFAGSIPPFCDIDHIDGNPLNNRLDNLQALTRAQHANKTLDLMLKKAFDSGYQKALLDYKIKV